MIVKFDPIIQEHIRCIQHSEIHSHYLCHSIQNELILMLASEIKNAIVKKIREAKYFSVVLYCTLEASHHEQMSLILRFVDVSTRPIKIEECFFGYIFRSSLKSPLNVSSTSINPKKHSSIFIYIYKLELDIDNVRKQGYDNGSNMNGKHHGVQKKKNY